MLKKYLAIAGILAIFIACLFSCKHELDFPIPPAKPIDTTHHLIDTTHIDTTIIVTPVDTCPAGVISFAEDVLPIIQTNCAKSGCHDSISRREGVVMNNYQNIISTGHISASNPLNNKFWRSLNSGDDPMPPPPNAPLTAAQLQIIQTWLQQGAQNTTCSHHAGCDTTNMSFAQNIYPILQTYCLGCHQTGSVQGGVDLTGYSNVLAQVNNGKLMKSIIHDPSVVAMPYNAGKFDDCTIGKFRNWINAGAPNN